MTYAIKRDNSNSDDYTFIVIKGDTVSTIGVERLIFKDELTLTFISKELDKDDIMDGVRLYKDSKQYIDFKYNRKK